MRQASQTELANSSFDLGPGTDAAPQDDPLVQDLLRRCSPQARRAAREFRRTGAVEHLPAVIDGVIEHYADPDVRPKLNGAHDNLRLAEDLAIDSLTMLEIIFLAEEVLGISVDNDEVRPFKTVGDVKRFIIAKVVQGARGRKAAEIAAPSR